MKTFLLCLFLFQAPAMAFEECLDNSQKGNFISMMSETLSNCSVVEPQRYNFCRALQTGMCSLVTGKDYDFCMALKTRVCSMAHGSQYGLCKGLTTGMCSLTDNQRDYWLCRGIRDGSCTVVRPEDYWMCRALTE